MYSCFLTSFLTFGAVSHVSAQNYKITQDTPELFELKQFWGLKIGHISLKKEGLYGKVKDDKVVGRAGATCQSTTLKGMQAWVIHRAAENYGLSATYMAHEIEEVYLAHGLQPSELDLWSCFAETDISIHLEYIDFNSGFTWSFNTLLI